MNKEYYKNTFSKVCPSDETIERIFDMTEKKTRKLKHKGLIIVLAVIFTLICGTLTVNAATDGALFDNVKIFINGKEYNATNPKKVIDQNGKEAISYKLEVPDKGSAEIVMNGDDSSGTLKPDTKS